MITGVSYAAPPAEAAASRISVKSTDVSGLSRKVKNERLSATAMLQTVTDSRTGLRVKRIVAERKNSRIDAGLKKVRQAASEDDSFVLNENFEGWDGEDADWLPENWTVRDESESGVAEKWHVASPDGFFYMGVDGNLAAVEYSSDFKDEWLVTPEFDVEEGMELQFRTVNDGLWYFSMDNVDWDLFEYIGDKIVACDLKVKISEDGGESWVELKSLASDFENATLEDLYDGVSYEMSTIKVPLAGYGGKRVMIGFQYVGTDGNTQVIDDVKVGLPALEVSYMHPAGTLWYGLSPQSYSLGLSLIAGPVCRPMTWVNLSYNPGATYSWAYFGPDNEWVTDNSQDELTVTFRPDYTSDFTTRNNLYYPPILTGMAAGATPGEYSSGDYVQAGGKAEFEITDPDTREKFIEPFGLGVVDPATEGTMTYTDMLVPIFGYSGDSDNYWTEYTFGDEGDEDNWSHLEGYMNYFMAGDAPMVIDGVWTAAFGKISDGALFKAEILPLSEEGIPGESIATALCAGSQVKVFETGGTSDYLTIGFTFDEPLVMSTEVCDAYMVRISGFRDAANVEYFSPVLSELSNPLGAYYGWVSKEMCWDGDVRESYTAVVNYTEGAQSFYIMLDAYFPWLEAEEECVINPGATVAHALDSYHDGGSLTVEGAPAWLTASASGRYGEAALNLTASADAAGDAEITVKGHGVSRKVTVKVDNSGVAGIAADDSGIAGIYTLQGVRVGADAAPGLYIVRMNDGSVRKTMVR